MDDVNILHGVDVVVLVHGPVTVFPLTRTVDVLDKFDKCGVGMHHGDLQEDAQEVATRLPIEVFLPSLLPGLAPALRRLATRLGLLCLCGRALHRNDYGCIWVGTRS